MARTIHRARPVRLLSRRFDRDHLRGWIEANREEQVDGKLRLFAEGLDRFGLPDLEVPDCRADQVLWGSRHGMLSRAMATLGI